MSEHMMPIPSRLYNAAVGGHVAGADQIIDDNENKKQSQINAEVKQILGQGGSVDSRISSAIDAAKSEIKGNATSACDTLGKAEALISSEKTRAQVAEEQLRTLYNNLQQSQPIPIDTLPATGEVGKIYRLAGTTSYADYMWNGTQFIKMAEYDNAIDDEPTLGSNNLVKSGGVYDEVTCYEKNFLRTISRTGSSSEGFGVAGNTGDSKLFKNSGNSQVTIKIYGPTTASFQGEITLNAGDVTIYTYVENSAGINLIWTSSCTIDIYEVSGIEKLKDCVARNEEILNDCCLILSENLIVKNDVLGKITPLPSEQVTVEILNNSIMLKDGSIVAREGYSLYKITATYSDQTSKKSITFTPRYVDNRCLQVAIFREGRLFYGIGTLVAGECYTTWLRVNEVMYLCADKYSYSTGMNLNHYVQPLLGKKVVSYGDSLVKGGGGWQTIIAELTGATVINSGIGGSTLAYRDREQYVNTNGYEVGDPKQGYQPQPGDTLINDTGSGSQRLSFIASDADVVLILFGTNDFHQNKAIGTFDDNDNTTFKGAIKTAIQWIRTNRPLCRIIFLTPTTERTEETNQLGLKKIDYVKAIIEAGVEMNIDIINLWSLTSWGTQNYSNYSVDSVHWNDLGKEIIGKIISKQLLGRF